MEVYEDLKLDTGVQNEVSTQKSFKCAHEDCDRSYSTIAHLKFHVKKDHNKNLQKYRYL